MSVTFDVPLEDSSHKPGKKAYSTVPASWAIPKLTGTAPEAAGASADDLVTFAYNLDGWGYPAEPGTPNHAALMLHVTPKMNGLLTAIHGAYDRHFPLVLSPDDIWIAIAQGFARHVTVHAEQLRSRFVAHEGKAEIVIRRDGFVKGSPDNDWEGAFDEFADCIGDHIGRGRQHMLTCRFSTTTPLTRAVSDVVLMDAMSEYFSYGMMTMCGIPKITLLGELADWKDIRARAGLLAEYDCEAWIEALTQVLDGFVAASAGAIDTEFWQCLYKRQGGSGGPWVTGWVNTLFPYLNSNLAGAAVENIHATNWRQYRSAHFNSGPKPEEFPLGLSRVPFKWNYYGTIHPMELIAGFIGATQDPKTLALRPVMGWGVADKKAEAGS